ncbi:hypothetical protein KR093_000191 [Drosophila rubida]|uniref:Protein kinase domain-containing protein n=1 Tax=Drosophila rubida TaxID=30044 RepID=A0AAD4K5Q1_9MUSC|nr:hypothetical protein KR093_000191 [Drosophila rubida]
MEDDKIERELDILSLVNHDNIVKLYGSSTDEDERIVIVMEYADCGCLNNILHNKGNENTILPHLRSINWMLQCAKGIEYLHDFCPKILHRDLKPKNLLIFNNFRTLKICDFGTVKQLVTKMSCVGTASYMAPEVSNLTSYTEKCDVYSFGITFWEVMSRKKPFYHLEGAVELHIRKKVIEGKRTP